MKLKKGRTALLLSECSYPCDYTVGITVFWQKAGCPDECKGVFPTEWGVNFVPWVELRFPVAVCVTSVDDVTFVQYFGNVTTVEAAIAKLAKIIDEKRSKYGFRLSAKEVRHLNEEVASLNANLA